MTPITGVDGKILAGSSPTALGDTADWSLSKSSNVRTFQGSAVPGYQRAVAGGRGAAGSFTLWVDAASVPYVREGGEYTMRFHVDATGNNYYSVPLIVTNVSIACSVDADGQIALACSFVSNGAWTENGILATNTSLES